MIREDHMDDNIRDALATYRHVEASAQLRVAVTAPPAPSPSVWHRHRIAFAGAAVATVAALSVGSKMVDGPSPENVEAPGSGLLDISSTQTVVFADGVTVGTEELFDPDNHDRLQDLFAQHGAELLIHERPVAPAADGRVFSVMVPEGMADEGTSNRIHLEAGGRVEVDVGVAEPREATAGLTLYELFPEVKKALSREDPAGTGRALEQLGFQVRWVLIEGPGRGHDVEMPPEGTVVIYVAGPKGEWTNVDPAIDTLMVEVATPETAQALGH